MAVKLVGKKLYDNVWTQSIVNKKELWTKFALDRNLDINGDYSNRHFEFKIEITFEGGKIILEGHRNYVDLPNVGLIEDQYNEVFSVIYKPVTPIDFPLARSYRKHLIGKLLLKMNSLKGFELNKTLNLGCKGIKEFNTISEIGFFQLEDVERVRSSTNGIKTRYGKLFAKARDIKQIDGIIESLKTLHNNG